MNREDAAKFVPIIQAFAEGKKIEIYSDDDDKWWPVGDTARYEEYICELGHYFTLNAYEWEGNRNPICPHCGAAATYHHSVDETNGMGEGNPRTYKAGKTEHGYSNVWHKDHLGNLYATKLMSYVPKYGEWDKL